MSDFDLSDPHNAVFCIFFSCCQKNPSGIRTTIHYTWHI